jgi:ABC-type branched-subunit amino acid transport system ATPase component
MIDPMLQVEDISVHYGRLAAVRGVDVADRVYVLRRGLIELEGNSEELADGERLHEAYFGFSAGGTSQEVQQ